MASFWEDGHEQLFEIIQKWRRGVEKDCLAEERVDAIYA